VIAMQQEMNALVQVNEGYASAPSAFSLEAMAPFVEARRIPVPAPCEGQVLVEVVRASVNPSDVMFIKGLYGHPRIKGKPAGFEGVGEVVASGGGAEADRLVGSRVAFVAGGAKGSGSWAEFAVADASSCFPLRPELRDEDGAAMIVNPLTALAMFDLVKHEDGKAFVLTAGASQLGKLLIRVASQAGYRPIAIVRRATQIEPLKDLGAAHVLDAEAPDHESELRAVMRGEKPRILLDAVTGPRAAHIFHLMPRHARWIIYGRLDGTPPTIREPGQMIFMHKRIEGFWLTEWMRTTAPEVKAQVIAEAQARFASGAWKTDVTAVVSLTEAMERLPAELAKPNGKVFIAPQQAARGRSLAAGQGRL
jgi:NADPH:quinone reductase-like Zn-dependent oxidoreductase